jgi:hypothetical protein
MAANWVETTVAMTAESLVASRVARKAVSWELMWAACSAVRWAGDLVESLVVQRVG